MSSKRWALFLSGRGSTAQSVLDLSSHLDIALVISSKSEAAGLGRARRMGIPSLVLPRKIDWTQLHQDLLRRRVTHIFLLGFMRLLPAEFVQEWAARIFNVHPSLLPAFPGARAIQESFAAGAPLGVTIHEVTAEMDAGPRRLQAEVVRPSAENLAQEFAKVEQRLIRHWAHR